MTQATPAYLGNYFWKNILKLFSQKSSKKFNLDFLKNMIMSRFIWKISRNMSFSKVVKPIYKS
jgi:hypothetical protein